MHAQRREDLLLQHRGEVRAERAGDDEAQHLGRVAVMHPLARVIGQGQGGERRHPLIRRHTAEQGRAEDVVMRLADRAAGREAIGEARPVRHQVFDGDHALCRLGLVERARRVLQHLHVGELRRPAGDRVIQAHLALFDQDHGRSGRHRLGHRGDAEQGVPLHRRLGLHVTLAEHIDGSDRPILPGQGHDPRQISAIDKRLQSVGDGGEPGIGVMSEVSGAGQEASPDVFLFSS